MVTKGQVIGGGVVIAVGTGAAVGGGILGTRSSSDNSIPYMVLSYEKNFSSIYSSTGTNEQVGKKFAWYLVGTYGVRGNDEKYNERWWESSYKQWESDLENQETEDLSESFKNREKVSSAFSTTDAKALNKVCEEVYKKKTSEIEFKRYPDDEKSKLGRDLLRYCSPLSEKPLTISDKREDYNNGHFGKLHKDDLIAVSGGSNDNYDFWILKDEEFFGKDGEDGLGKELDSNSDSLFHELYQQKNNKDKRGWIKWKCGDAYLETKSSGKVKEESLLKFCTFNYKPQPSR